VTGPDDIEDELPFDEAVVEGSPLVAAWDHDDTIGERLVLFRVGVAGWLKLAETAIPELDQESMHERLVRRGVRVGATCGHFVWVFDEQGFGVWNETSQTIGSRSASPVVGRVHVAYEGGAPDRRAVLLEQASGGTDVIAEERSLWPSLDITYNSLNLELDTAWAHHLSVDLALWHLLPLVNDIAPFEIDSQLEVARAASALADSVRELPAVGTFDAPSQPLAGSSTWKERVLAVIPDPNEPARRTVEVRLTSPEGRSSRVIVKQGTNAQVAAFLGRVTTPGAVLTAISGIHV